MGVKEKWGEKKSHITQYSKFKWYKIKLTAEKEQHAVAGIE